MQLHDPARDSLKPKRRTLLAGILFLLLGLAAAALLYSMATLEGEGGCHVPAQGQATEAR